jgi:hypothetical protein
MISVTVEVISVKGKEIPDNALPLIWKTIQSTIESYEPVPLQASVNSLNVEWSRKAAVPCSALLTAHAIITTCIDKVSIGTTVYTNKLTTAFTIIYDLYNALKVKLNELGIDTALYLKHYGRQ